jgi:protein gp37
VFCASLADVFDNQVPARWRDDLWHLIDMTPYLHWLLLTKRPQNIAKMLPTKAIGVPEWGSGWKNVWLGVTAENQDEADRRIPILLKVPAAVHFVSYEPALGPVDFVRLDVSDGNTKSLNALTGDVWIPGNCGESSQTFRAARRRLDWIICGGESGSKARPMELAWARSARDQCKTADVAFFMKQIGGPSQRSMPGIPEDLNIRVFPR